MDLVSDELERLEGFAAVGFDTLIFWSIDPTRQVELFAGEVAPRLYRTHELGSNQLQGRKSVLTAHELVRLLSRALVEGNPPKAWAFDGCPCD